MMRNLLTYLWEHRGEPLSEYAVAIDVLGKAEDFDPRTDSTVRVQISRLRAKLKEFYEHRGEQFPLKLSIPVGRHDLQWSYAEAAPKPTVETAVVSAAPIPVRDSQPRSRGVMAGIAIALLSLLVAGLYWRVRSLETAAVVSAPALPRFWASFAAGTKPVQIVLPSPLYFFWPDRGLNVRDLNVSEFPKWETSPWLREMAAKWGPPKLSQNYVGAPEMNAGIRLLQYLQGRVGQLEVIESRKFAADSVGARNTVFIGMPRTAVYLDTISQKLNFYIARVEPDAVGNRSPKSGEPKEFLEVDYSADRVRFPGIIAFLPPRPEGSRTLLLLGRSPVSIATLLTSADGLRIVEDQWRKGGSPDAWEMVIEADVYRGDTVSKVSPVAFRTIPDDFWK